MDLKQDFFVNFYINYQFHNRLPTNEHVINRILAMKHDKIIKPYRVISREIEKIVIASGLKSFRIDRMECQAGTLEEDLKFLEVQEQNGTGFISNIPIEDNIHLTNSSNPKK
ncbi:hypothetical protein A3Q56_04667 [Intoshia linei]|uniref:Uncharacterized protein n=1 Tax=Intoshia linei TaxID=1819745 RepID=A0A177B1W1_9BILA|nr:hypothetical protein A3Q56_04667 [Intoshia linei]